MRKANSYKTYGRTVGARNTAASITFDEIIKKKEFKDSSPFGTSDSSTGSYKDEEFMANDRPSRRCTQGKRVIMPIEIDNSREECSPAPNEHRLNVSFTFGCLVVLSPLEKRKKMSVLKSQDGNVKQMKKTSSKREKQKKPEKHIVQDKENSLNGKSLNFADIEQDSLIIESDHMVQEMPQSSTPNSVLRDKSMSRIPNLDKREMDVSNIKSDCEDDHCSFGSACSPPESHNALPTHNFTLRRSTRKAKGRDPNLWEDLMKKSCENVHITNDDVYVGNSSDCEDDHCSFGSACSPPESHNALPTHNFTLRRSTRKAKGSDPNLWEDLMKKSCENIHITNDDVYVGNSSADADHIACDEINQSSSLFDTTEEDEIVESDEDILYFEKSPASLLCCISEESEDMGQFSLQEVGEENESCSNEDSASSHQSEEKSFYEKLTCSSMHEGEQESAEERLLSLCDQTDFIKFSTCIPQRMMSECVKIGEGVYGEVFRSIAHGRGVAIKVVPMEGDFEVNDCPQKLFQEVLPEVVIAKELSDLAYGTSNRSENFCQVNRISCVQDTFPDHLLHQWDEYTKKKRSENDRPDMFPEDQLFMVFEFADGGTALENFTFSNHSQAFSALRQVVYALAVAESALEFEHRDLHIGNVLVRKCEEDIVSFLLEESEIVFPSEGVFATIIDFTISRLKKDGCAVFCDVSTDDGLFEGKGDIQFDVYRNMKQENNNEWSNFCPHSNILWVHYLCEKFNTVIKYKDSGRGHRDAQRRLRSLSSFILDFKSCHELSADLSLWVL